MATSKHIPGHVQWNILYYIILHIILYYILYIILYAVYIKKMGLRKNNTPISVMYRELLSEIADNDFLRIYTDGSVKPVTGRAGAAVCVYDGNRQAPVVERQARLADFSIVNCYHYGNGNHQYLRNAIIICDSQTALKCLNGKKKLNDEIVCRIRKQNTKLKDNNICTRFMWVPSHIGISENEKAIKLAQEAAQKNDIDVAISPSMQQIRGKIKTWIDKKKRDERRLRVTQLKCTVR